MTVEGITHYHCLNRIAKAKKRLHQLRLIGLNNTGFHPPTNRRTYITLVRSMTEHQIHITPLTNTLAIAYQSLENEFFNAVSGFKWRKAQWWRKAFKLQSAAYRRVRLRDNLRLRLSSEERPELGNLQHALTRARNLEVCPGFETFWNLAEDGKVRKLPLPTGNRLIPVLYCCKNKHKALRLQRYVHSFPRNPSAIISKLGSQGAAAIRDLELLWRATWTSQDTGHRSHHGTHRLVPKVPKSCPRWTVLRLHRCTIVIQSSGLFFYVI